MNEANQKPGPKTRPKTVDEIYEAALQLPEQEQDKLYWMLMKDQKSAVDPEVERAAIAECERRDTLVREGKMELLNVDDVIRQARRIVDDCGQ